MQTRGLLIGVLVLAVLGGAIWWTNREPKPGEAAKSSEQSTKLTNQNEADLVEIKIEQRGEPAKQLTRQPGQAWKLASELTKDPKFPTDAETANAIATNSAAIASEKLVDENASDLIQYGLDPPQLLLEIKDKAGKTEKLHLGDDTPVGQMVYAVKPGTRKVFTVARFVKEALAKSVADLRDKHLLLVDEAKLTRLEFSRKGESIEFSKDAQGEWQVVQPEPMRADNLAVSEHFRKAREAKYTAIPTPEEAKKNAAAFAAATPLAVLRVSDAAGAQSLEIRKAKDNSYLAKASANEGIYSVTEELGSAVDKAPEEFRNKKLFSFGFAELERIEVKNNGKATLLERKGEDWLLGGKKADASTVQPVVDQLRMMQAMKFARNAVSSPFFEISIQARGTKSSEQLQVSRKGNFHYAKRVGEAVEFEIDPKLISDLESALSSVKLDTGKKN
jgi:hypothetical protein